ncbi:RNA polymerase sigma factor [Sanguibacter sp. Z1732]|uniref:RNA polymerase sigma factor n=1 Tax=Sanguibacter sp. Z1732 TaxID=3435412 RepID=UPI003D9C802C
MAAVSRADRADDAALLAGLALDDPAVSAAFVRRFQSAVFGMAVSITRDAALAQDVSQEVFVRVWRAAGSYDLRRASVLTWLLTITRNAAIDAVRARRAEPTDDLVLDRLLHETLSSAPDLEESAVHRLETEQAIRRLHRIAPRAGPRGGARRRRGLYGGRGEPPGTDPAGHRQDPHPHRAAQASGGDGGGPWLSACTPPRIS